MVDEKIWRSLKRPEFGTLNAISNCIHKYEWNNPGCLTSVRLGDTLLITSDYSGYTKESAYESISILVADLSFCWLWDEFRKTLREDIIKDRRRISYKRLGDRKRRRALVPFLRASNSIPGLLISFLIDKELLSWFKEDQPKEASSEVGSFGRWNTKSFHKLTRVGHLVAMVVAGMSAPNQEILWFTDKDEIAPNDSKIIEATRLIAHYLSHYLPHEIKKFRFGTSQSDDGSQFLNDLITLPDLAAGALSEVLTSFSNEYKTKVGKLVLPFPKKASWKSKEIMSWLLDNAYTLKKMVVCLDSKSSNGYSIKIFHSETSFRNSKFN